MQFLGWTYGGNSVQAWLIALLAGAATLLLLTLLQRALVGRLKALAGRTHTAVDDAVTDLLAHTHSLFRLVLSVYTGSLLLTLPPVATGAVHGAIVLATAGQGALWGNRFITFWLNHYRERHAAQDPTTASTVGVLGFVGRLVLWVAVGLLTLQNLGFRIDALLAGLGVGGVAVALAVQNILGDLFASLSIVLDKPFLIGDFIVVDQHMGTVEHIGLKTTRLRSLSGEQLVFSNSDLLRSRIRNYKRMYERRVEFKIGVVYGTAHADLQRIPAMLAAIVSAQPSVRFERAHFKSFGAYSLDFEVIYWVTDADYNLYMDIQQAINLEIYRQFAAARIKFAQSSAYVKSWVYPRRTCGGCGPMPTLRPSGPSRPIRDSALQKKKA